MEYLVELIEITWIMDTGIHERDQLQWIRAVYVEDELITLSLNDIFSTCKFPDMKHKYKYMKYKYMKHKYKIIWIYSTVRIACSGLPMNYSLEENTLS